MRLTEELASSIPPKETFLTIGVFDGVHMGHRYLLSNLKTRAQRENLLSLVITFNPHPQSVLHPHIQVPRLSSIEDRVKLLEQTGMDLVLVLSFTPEVAQLRAREFVSLMKEHLKMHGLMVGPDFTLGRGQEGDINLLRSLGQEMGFSVEVVSPFTIDGEIVSSTLIRQSLAQGDIMKVERLIGRRVHLIGEVVTGDKRGRKLGVPTANLDMPLQQALPGDGIYATIAYVDGRQFASATNIGTRPTFGNGKKTVETHLLNYEGDLYGKKIKVEFIKRLREEQFFASPEDLRTQIKKDIENATAILSRELK